MLGFYLLLLFRIGKDYLTADIFRRMVAILNLTSISMALATFTGRFVYPLLSLEGRRMWVIALAPWTRTRVVTAKMLFSLVVGLPVATGLVIFSGYQLELSLKAIAFQAFITMCMGIALSASALGTGARFVDYKQENPAKLVSGFGGTVNLLLSLVLTGLLLVGSAPPLFAEMQGADAWWLWLAAILWALLITYIWTSIGVRTARKWFGLEAVPQQT